MRTLGAWLGAIVALAAGIAVGRRCGPELAAMLVVAAIVLSMAAVTVSFANEHRRPAGWLVAALLLAAFARGTDHGGSPALGLREDNRGLPTGIRDLEVVGASVPGPRCRVRVRPVGQDLVVWVSLAPERCPLASGERLRVLARSLRPRDGPWRPGAPDPTDGAIAAGADAAAHVDDVWIGPGLEPTALDGWWRFIARQRQRAWNDSRGDDARAFVAAAVLGVRSALSPRRRAELRAAGLGHLVAVSGLHVGLAAWLAFFVLLRVLAGIGGGIGPGVAVALALVILYVGVTGAAASAVRAAIMAGLVAVGMLAGRPHHGLTTLAIACALMLIVRPAWIVDPGFQMSAAAMLAIVAMPPGSGVIATTWRVTWAIAPVSIVHFSTVSAWGLIGNVVAIPIVAGWVLPLGLAGWLGAAWWDPAAWDLAALGGGLVLDLAAGLHRLPVLPIAAVVAIASLAIGAAVLVRNVATHARARRIAIAIVPPMPYAIATLGAALYVGAVAPPVELAWLAEGTVRRFSVIAIDVDGGIPYACVDAPRGDPDATLQMLQALGVHALGDVTPPDDPAAAALVRTATHAGWATGAGACAPPPPADVRTALRECKAADHGSVAAQDEHGRRRCFADGHWRNP